MPRIEFGANELSGEDGNGLEIGVRGFKTNPADLYEQPSQIYVEVYNGKLRVHVWDDQSQDPKATVEIDAIA